MSVSFGRSELGLSRATLSAAGLFVKARMHWVLRILVAAAVIPVWALLHDVSGLVPAIEDTVATLGSAFSQGWIVGDLASTMSAAAGGFGVAAAVGVPAGVALGSSRALWNIFNPFITGAFAIPRIIFLPILFTLFGIGIMSKASMATLSAVFPITLATASATRNVNPVLMRLSRSLGMTPPQTALKIILPAIAPAMAVALRLGLSVSLVVVVIAEFFASKSGLGLVASRAYGQLDLPRLYAVILLIFLIALSANLALWWLEGRLRRRVE